jgi:hypothetical protein
MGHGFGGWRWAEKSGGALSAGERWAETCRGLWSLGGARAQRVLRAMGLGPKDFRILLEEVPRPRTPLVQVAEARLLQLPSHLIGHSERTYAFGAMLGARDGLNFDPERLLLGALLHDLGLARTDGASCFAWRGAQEAAELLRGAGGNEALIGSVSEAITLHLNAAPSGPVEAQLLRRGAGLDVVADEFYVLAAASRREVVAKWPRGDFAKVVSADLRGEATRHPETRVGFLCHQLGFTRLIHRADRMFLRDQEVEA